MKTVIKTNRLILRPWRIEDAQDMFKYAKDPDVGPKAGWPPHRSIEDSEVIINKFIDHHPYCFAMTLVDTLEVIGCIELKLAPTDLAANDNEAEIGYWLGKPFWNNGYMSEAVKVLIEFGFNELNKDIIWCGYYEGNLRSKRVQEKCGFKFHHKSENLYLPLLKEYRTGYVNIFRKTDYIK